MSKEQLELFQLLYQSNYESHKSIIPKRVPGTLEWFFHHSDYIKWRDSPGDAAIWITADPGCGKTVLASSVIDELCARSTPGDSDQDLIWYFFFKDDNETQASASLALCSVLHQVVSSDNRLITPMMKEFRAKKDKFLSDPYALWKVFIDTISDSTYQHVICVLDALDECSVKSRDIMIGRIVDAFNDHAESDRPKSRAKLKLLMTSRPLASIEKSFSRISRIRLKAENETKAVERDIGRVISARLDEIAGNKYFTLEVRNELQKTLTGNADRTFLWVSLILQQIEDSISASQSSLEAILSLAPPSLDDLYEKILSESRDQVTLRKLLHIIVSAKTYLSLTELNTALHIDSSDSDYKSLQRRCQPSMGMESYIKHLCGSFVRISQSYVHLVHQTAKDFLIQQQIPNETTSSAWKHSLAPTESNVILARSCIWYILLAEFDITWVKLSDKGRWTASPRLGRFLKDHDFLDYSSRYWTTHFRAVPASADDVLINSARELCRTETPRFRTWYKVYWSSFSRGSPKTYTDLGEAAAFGVVSVVEVMLKEGLDINAVDADGDTPLITACMHKQHDAARFLIEQGAATDIAAHDGNVALSTASAFGLAGIVELLLQGGVDANPCNKQGKTPLDRAYEFGHADCVGKLLQYGAKENVARDHLGRKTDEILHLPSTPAT